MCIPNVVKNKIMDNNSVQQLSDDEAQVVCVTDSVTNYGDTITAIGITGSRKALQHRCIGAKKCFGDAVYIAFNANGNVNIIKGVECTEAFPFEDYDSPIKM